MIHRLAIAGAGTMGSGIALAAALNNFETVLFDVAAPGLEKAKQSIIKNLDFLSSKQKITAEEKEETFARIQFTDKVEHCTAPVIIEAIAEDLHIKQKLFSSLAEVNTADAIFASNTSSLSVTAIQAAIPNPSRVCGMHFFNPAHIMKLVEVVKGEQTSELTIEEIRQLCILLKKVPVICSDGPGFIVNRVARHFYLEAMNSAAAQGLAPAVVDEIMENAGFKMGPFRLMDMIGMDVNLAVSQSLYNAFDQHPRFKPAVMQEENVAAGNLGRKTGKGFYDYTANTPVS